MNNPLAAREVSMKPLRVLVVEDNAMIGMLLAEMLVAMGHDVCAVEMTEAGGVAAAARLRPDLMIVDAQLDQGSGLAAMRTILRAGPMPHLFISGADVETDSPDTVVLQKPFHERQLVCALDRVLAAVETA
jgi:DNA-binding response OmpR family regulator